MFVISLSSPGYEQTFGELAEMPYLSQTLRPQGELLSDYSLLTAEPRCPTTSRWSAASRPTR